MDVLVPVPRVAEVREDEAQHAQRDREAHESDHASTGGEAQPRGTALLLFPRGCKQRDYASLFISVANTTQLPPQWTREVHFALTIVDQKESLCSITRSTRASLSNTMLDWGFTELVPLATLHSASHGYILDDTLTFTCQFERISGPGTQIGSATGGGGRGAPGWGGERGTASPPNGAERITVGVSG